MLNLSFRQVLLGDLLCLWGGDVSLVLLLGEDSLLLLWVAGLTSASNGSAGGDISLCGSSCMNLQFCPFSQFPAGKKMHFLRGLLGGGCQGLLMASWIITCALSRSLLVFAVILTKVPTSF